MVNTFLTSGPGRGWAGAVYRAPVVLLLTLYFPHNCSRRSSKYGLGLMKSNSNGSGLSIFRK